MADVCSGTPPMLLRIHAQQSCATVVAQPRELHCCPVSSVNQVRRTEDLYELAVLDLLRASLVSFVTLPLLLCAAVAREEYVKLQKELPNTTARPFDKGSASRQQLGVEAA